MPWQTLTASPTPRPPEQRQRQHGSTLAAHDDIPSLVTRHDTERTSWTSWHLWDRTPSRYTEAKGPRQGQGQAHNGCCCPPDPAAYTTELSIVNISPITWLSGCAIEELWCGRRQRFRRRAAAGDQVLQGHSGIVGGWGFAFVASQT